MSEMPSGTVTFLFTDLEGSTRLWEEHPEAMRPALARHDEILRETVAAHDGHIVKTTGDGMHAVFATARDALDTAVAVQRELAAESFAETGPLRVRMGVHTCEAEFRDRDYYGSEVNRAARLMSVAHGGQIVVSAVTAGLVRDAPVELIDLGEHRLRDLTIVDRIFQAGDGVFPPLRSLDSLPGNLPRQATTFVGRDAEIASIAEVVRQSSLVTLTGVGGVGKTRLALQVAAEVVAEFPDGAWLCEFASVTDPAAVWDTLAACLRVQPYPGRSLEESVLEYLSAKRLLLVLDNCEHLLDAIAGQVDAIARRSPRVSVLATSREGLALAGERIVAVPTLGVPRVDAAGEARMQADAVRLFADRAAAAQRDFVLTDHNVETVAVLCRRLDGIPLAIELAAARVRSMAPEDLVARLDQRFKLLTRGSRAALERHQTLRSTIDWSYDLLDPTERVALDRLSVFAGGCDLAAAEAVLARDDLDAFEVDDVLAQLVDKSLVVVDRNDIGVRYRLLETIRQYAAERLQASGDTADVRRGHAEYCIEQAVEAGPHLRRREQPEWAERVAPDTDNFRAALDWAVETESADHALRLVAPLCVRGAVIGDVAMDWAAVAIEVSGAAEHPLFPEVAAWASWGATVGRDLERAEQLAAAAEHAEELLGTRHPTVALARATVATQYGPQGAQDAAAEWLARARAVGDPYDIAHALTMLGLTFAYAGDTGPATTTLDEAARVAREAGITAALTICLSTLAQMLPVEEAERALALLDEAVELGTRTDDRMSTSTAIMVRGMFMGRLGDWRAALRDEVDAAEVKRSIGDSMGIHACFWNAGVACCALGCFEPAAVLVGKGDAMSLGRFGWGWGLDLLTATDAALVEALGERQVAAFAGQGAALEMTDAVDYLRAEADRILADADGQ